MPTALRTIPTPTRSRRCRGAAYVVALLVTTIVAAMVLVFAREMRARADASANRASQVEAHWVAHGALEAIRGDLASVIELGEAPRLDQVGAQAQPLGDGLFWLIRPDHIDDTQTGFGLQGEAGKINVAIAAAAWRINIPRGNQYRDDRFQPIPIDTLELTGMTENLAASMADWQDRNEDITPGGAESAFYLARDTPYNIKDRNLETVGELLYVRGMTPDLLYGEDTNRNYRLDPNENDGDANPPFDNADGKLDRGLIDLFTIYSIDSELSDSGEEKLTLDTQTAQSERNRLRAFLQRELGEERGNEVAEASWNKTNRINGENQFYLSALEFFPTTGVSDEEFQRVHDGIMRLDDEGNIVGLIDVYHASEEVLTALPWLDSGDARALIAGRPILAPGEPVPNLSWIIDVLGEDKAIEAARYLTHRSHQVTADIVALSGDGRGFCRLRVVLDCLPVLEGDQTLPVIRHVEDLTALGWPLDEAIRDLVRGGASPEEIATIYSEDAF